MSFELKVGQRYEITKFLVDILSEVDAEIRERVLTHLEKQDRKSSKKEPKNAK